MSTGNQGSFVDDEYPNIDSDDDQIKHEQDQSKKKVKPNQQSNDKIRQQIFHNKNSKPMPPGLPFPKPNQGSFPMPFLPGRINFPPPPPTQKKPPPTQKYNPAVQNRQTVNKHYEKDNYGDSSWRNEGYNRGDRKNTIFIKNIPKAYNSNEKLTTFFRTYGNLRQIRCNDDKNEAFVKFKRQQDAAKFMNSNTKIFNRTYIVFGYEEDIQVPEKSIQQRENDLIGIHRKPLAIQFQQMKANIEQASLDKYRALLFVQKYLQDQQIKEQVKVKIADQKKFKSTIFKFNQQQANYHSANLRRQYSWAISNIRQFQEVAPSKKDLILLYIIYGPISSLSFTVLDDQNLQRNQKSQIDQQSLKNQKTQGQTAKVESSLSNKKRILVKIKFLAPKGAWKMFLDHKNRLQLKGQFIQIEGEELRSLFNSGKLKVIEDLHTKKAIKPKFQMPSPRNSANVQNTNGCETQKSIQQQKQENNPVLANNQEDKEQIHQRIELEPERGEQKGYEKIQEQ